MPRKRGKRLPSDLLDMLEFLVTKDMPNNEWFSICSVLKQIGWPLTAVRSWSSAIPGYENDHGIDEEFWKRATPLDGGVGVIVNAAKRHGYEQYKAMKTLKARCDGCNELVPLRHMVGPTCTRCLKAESS